MKFTHGMLLAVALVLCLLAPVSAWGTSMAIATTDSYSSSTTGTCTSQMGCYSPADYAATGRTFTSLDTSGVNAASLTGKDTLVFWGKNPSTLSAQDKADINAWIANGGKLIIWDSETAAAAGGFDYTWLTYPFSVAAPGAYGATGWPLWIEEENQLSTFAAGPYQINNLSLSQNTDAVGDAAIFTARNPTDWCVDMRARNVLQVTGPTHVYSKSFGSGIVIYSGLDWDYQTADLKKMLRQEFDANYLPCTVHWTGNIEVTKSANKAVYVKGETITFTVTVKNPADNPNSVYLATMTDTPPAEITLIDPASYSLGTITPGEIKTTTITATADTCGTNLINNAAALGKDGAGNVIYSGNDQAVFDIVGCGPNVPEFPTLALPVGMILGFVFIVYGMKRKDE